MNLIFQSGEFYNETSLWVSLLGILASLLGAVISGVIAVWIFKRGLDQEKKKEEQRLQTVKEFFQASLNMLQKPIDNQVANIDEFCTELEKRNFDIPMLTFVTSLNIDSIESIEPKDLFKIYLNGEENKKTESFQLLMSKLILIRRLADDTNRDFNAFSTYFKQFEADYHKYVEEVVDLFNVEVTNNLIAFGKHEITGDNYLMEINKIFFTWSSINGNRDPYTALDNLIEPIYSFVNEKMADERSPRLARSIHQIKFAFENVEHLKSTYAKEFRVISKKLVSSKSDIDKAIAELDIGLRSNTSESETVLVE